MVEATRLLLINPNTNPQATAAMLAIACESAPDDVEIVGATAWCGAALITDEAALSVAAETVTALGESTDLVSFAGVIIAAFSDPGRSRLVAPCLVTGIAEAGMGEAAAAGRAFAVVTTTPDLAAAIVACARSYGHVSQFRGTWFTSGDPATLMADPSALEAALMRACLAAIGAGAAAVVIGGGPLASAARALVPCLPVPVIEPVPAAVRLAFRRASARVMPRDGANCLTTDARSRTGVRDAGEGCRG